MLRVLRVGAHYSASSSPRPAASCKIPGNEPDSEPAHELVKEALVGDARFRAQCARSRGNRPAAHLRVHCRTKCTECPDKRPGREPANAPAGAEVGQKE